MAVAKQLIKEKKNWYPVVSSDLFPNSHLGDVPVLDADALLNRKITVNLMTLTNDAKHQSVNICFKIDRISENKAYAKVISFQTSLSSLKRFVRRDISRIDESFVCETADKKQFRIKVMVLTKTKTTSSVLKSLRKVIINSTAKEASKVDFESFLRMAVSFKLQVTLKDQLKKIYPVKGFEVKSVELLAKTRSKAVSVKDMDNSNSTESSANEDSDEEN